MPRGYSSELLERLLAEQADTRARIASERARLRARYGGIDHTRVRTWARANGHEVGVRGRCPQPLVEAFLADQAAEQMAIDL